MPECCLSNRSDHLRVQMVLNCIYVRPMKRIASNKRALLAIVGCVALLYFATGAAFVHSHTGNGGTAACHVCQSLHVPALVAARQHVIPEARQMAGHRVFPDSVTPLEAFVPHRASRAPPSA
jgi:hypothetical protein